MAERVARIRPFQASDDKVVRLAIGKANMESLAVANRRGYAHPLTVATWLLLTYAFIRFMNMMPTGAIGFLGYVRPFPMMAAVAVLIMAFIDWFNRPDFERAAQNALRGRDMHDILGHYSRSPSSGFWILDYDNHFVGLIALDASGQLAETAVVRHFYVDEVYRSSGVQVDLVRHAVQLAFDSDDRILRINAPDSPLTPYIGSCLQEAGFAVEYPIEEVGLFKWKIHMRTLEREVWKIKSC